MFNLCPNVYDWEMQIQLVFVTEIDFQLELIFDLSLNFVAHFAIFFLQICFLLVAYTTLWKEQKVWEKDFYTFLFFFHYPTDYKNYFHEWKSENSEVSKEVRTRDMIG